MMKRITLALSLAVGLLCASQAQVMMLFSQDSLTGIVSPLDVDSLFYWFAADVGVTDSLGGAIATDEGVGSWLDLSGRGHHVTQSTNGARPVYKATGGPGSKPCIQFDGTDDFLASAAHWWGSDDLTVFVVMKFANATRDATEVIVGKKATTANERQWSLEGKNLNPYPLELTLFKDGTLANYNFFRGGFKSTSFRAITALGNGASSDIFIDNSSISAAETVVGSGDRTVLDVSRPLAIGAQNTDTSAGLFLLGSISEIIVYSRALTAAERIAIENYLNRKYDLY